ncbi:hypothetical protein [Poriferisphaera sp. WC338]|uniref:hypothetical protein n=1 Tax=Poriferisphaera sp. WC338 TaxID=3425129 RepID=UPI003D81B623
MMTPPIHLITLAQTLVNQPSDAADRFKWGLTLIIGLGILGIFIIVALTITYRRTRRRLNRLEADIQSRRAEQSVHVDTWESAADRVDHNEALAATFDDHMAPGNNPQQAPPPPGYHKDDPNHDSDTIGADYTDGDDNPWDTKDWHPDDDAQNPGDLDDPDDPDAPPPGNKYW